MGEIWRRVRNSHFISQIGICENHKAASIAATGFGLTALCTGHERKILTFSQATDRVITALRFLAAKIPSHRAFFTIGPMLVPATESGTRKSPRSTQRSCFAAY